MSAKDDFSAAASPTSEAEKALQGWGIAYKKQPDGTILVRGDLDISGKGLTRLPGLSCVTVERSFWCYNNQLTTLEGAPASVGGSFSCNNNQLTSLKGAPASIGENFSCSHNQLTSLEGAPASVGKHFFCSHSQLTSLEHAPASVGKDFWCHDNQLTTLEGAPTSIGGDFLCRGNQCTSLEHAPQKFTNIYSDLGTFSSWDEVPENLRISHETRERQAAEEAAELERQVQSSAGPLKRDTPAPKVIRFK